VSVSDDVIVPALRSASIPTLASLKSVSSTVKQCMLDIVEPVSGLFVARSVIPIDNVHNYLMVYNIRDTSLIVPKGTTLSTTVSVDVHQHELKVNRSATQQSAENNHHSRSHKLQSVIDKIMTTLPTELTAENKRDLYNVLRANEQCLSVDEFDLGFTDIVEHTTDIGNSISIRETLRRQPMAYLNMIDEHVDRMETAGIIKKTNSARSSNDCLVKKKHGSLRFAIYYRNLNKITTVPSYPMPRVDTCINSMGHSSWFSTLDLRSVFWQVKQAEKDIRKTAFITRKGCYEFTRLPFGLSGSPILFQRLADLIFSGLTWDIHLVFLDDINIFANSIAAHMERLALVLSRLREANLKISPQNVIFSSKVSHFSDSSFIKMEFRQILKKPQSFSIGQDRNV
jgi:hypothetical protein